MGGESAGTEFSLMTPGGQKLSCSLLVQAKKLCRQQQAIRAVTQMRRVCLNAEHFGVGHTCKIQTKEPRAVHPLRSRYESLLSLKC